MKLFFARLTSVLLLSAFVSLAYAQVDAAAAERILRKSGTWSQIDAVTPQFKTAFAESIRQQSGAAVKELEIERFAAVAERAFAATKLKTMIANTVAEQTNPQHVAALDKWYDGPIGKRLTALEEAAAKLDQGESVKEGAALVAALKAPRLAIVQEMVDVTRAADFIADLSINMGTAVAYGASLASSEVEVPLKQLRENAMKEREPMIKVMRDYVLSIYAKTYEKASDEDLKAYIAFMKTPAGKQFTEVIITAFERAFVASAADLGKSLVELRKSAKT
jgi:hypothetical protein